MMYERTKVEQEDRGRIDVPTDLLRSRTQQLLAQALQAEVAKFLVTHANQQDEAGHAWVVRSGHHPKRDIQTGIGPVTVQVLKVQSRQSKPVAFHSVLVPRMYARQPA